MDRPLVYFLVFGLVFVINCVAIRQKKPRMRNIFLVVGFLILLFFIGFRESVGTDYDTYLGYYKSLAVGSWNDLFSFRIELFVSMLFKMCSLFLPDPRLIFLVLGFFLLYPIYRINRLYDYKYLAYSVLTFCCLFLPFSLNGMRQGVAMGYLLLSFVHFLKGNRKWGCISYIVAALFHTSTLIGLPYVFALFMHKKKGVSFTKFNVLLTGIMTVMVLFALSWLLSVVGFTKYDYIFENVSISHIAFGGISFYLFLIVLLLFLKGRKEEKDEIMVLKNLTVSGVFYYIIGTAARYLSRFGLYFIFSSILLAPMLIQNVADKNTRLLIKLLFVVYLIVFFYVQSYVLGWHQIIPYKSWLFEGGLL